MPDLAALVLFNLTLLAALASPGPAMILAIRNTVVGGIGSGLRTGIGLALVAGLWTATALLGLGAVFAVVPWLYGALKFVGALYLLWLAVTMWRSADTTLDMTNEHTRLHHPLRDGMLVNLLNPKSVLFAGAVLVVIFPAGLGAMGSVIVVVNHIVVEIAAYGLLAIAFSRPVIRAGFLRAKSALDRAAGAIMAALGLRLLFERS